MNPLCFLLISSFLLLFLDLPFIFHGAGVNGNHIITTCRNAANTDPNVSYNSCVSSLQVNRCNNETEALQELVIATMEKSIYFATNMTSYIQKYLDDEISVDQRAKKYLKDCLELYTDIIPDIQEAITDFKAMDYKSVAIKMSAAMEVSTTCEDGFKEDTENPLVSPVEMEDNEFYELTRGALEITNELDANIDSSLMFT